MWCGAVRCGVGKVCWVRQQEVGEWVQACAAQLLYACLPQPSPPPSAQAIFVGSFHLSGQAATQQHHSYHDAAGSSHTALHSAACPTG